MVQGAKVHDEDFYHWFRSEWDDFQQVEKEKILNDIGAIFKEASEKSEKKIFKYIVKYAFGHVDSPKIIEGLPAYFPSWEPLSPAYARRKKSNKKWTTKRNNLKNYLLGLTSAQYWYGKPQIKLNYLRGIVTYISMFNYERKMFRGTDRSKKTPVLQEMKIQMSNNLQKGGDSTLRPIFEPMEEFLFNEKFNQIVDNLIEEYMEDNYEGKYHVPTTYE